MGVLSSPRRRRRLVWGGAGVFVVVGVAFSMVHWSNTAHQPVETFARGPELPPEPEPELAPFSQARKEGVLKIAAQFLETAVARKNVERSWELTAPSLRSGYTKRTWATDDIPVQPYPVDAARWDVGYSLKNTVGLRVALFPPPKSDVPAAVFDLQLQAFGTGKNRRWLVDSWTPASYVGIPSGPLGSSRAARAPRFEKGRIGTMWVFAPVGVFVLLGLLLTFHFGREWWSGKRAERRYKATLS